MEEIVKNKKKTREESAILENLPNRSEAPLVAQLVKNLPAVLETWVQSVGREDPLEEGMATHSRVLAWRIPRTGEPGGLPSLGSHRVSHD